MSIITRIISIIGNLGRKHKKVSRHGIKTISLIHVKKNGYSGVEINNNSNGNNKSILGHHFVILHKNENSNPTYILKYQGKFI